MRKLITVFALALLTTPALAQSSPGLKTNQVPTAAQWNSYFAAKQDVLGYTPLNTAGGTMSGRLVTSAPTTAGSGFRLPPGTAPTTPANGDLWSTSGGLFVQIAGATVGPLSGPSGGSFAATAPLAVSFPAGVVTYAINGVALTKTDDTNVTLTLGGDPTTALVTTASITVGWTGQLALTRGGTNASLVASNGGIVYSTASAFAVLSGTATAGQMLRSGASAAPTWSTATFPATATGTGTILRADGTNWVATTATYPTTTTVSQILYSSSANVIGGITTGNNGVLITSAGGVPSISSTLPSAVQGNITSLGTIATGVWNGTDIAVADGGTGSSTASGARTNLAAASTTANAQTGGMSFYFTTVADQDYRVVIKIPFGGTITETTTRSVSGTCTFTSKINTTALGGTANSVSTTEQAQAHASANAFVADDDIVITVSGNSACTGVSYTAKYTYTLSGT